MPSRRGPSKQHLDIAEGAFLAEELKQEFPSIAIPIRAAVPSHGGEVGCGASERRQLGVRAEMRWVFVVWRSARAAKFCFNRRRVGRCDATFRRWSKRSRSFRQSSLCRMAR